MKKLLLLKKITFLFVLVLLLSATVSAQEKLIYVTDTLHMRLAPGETEESDTLYAEQHIVEMFIEDGYDVEVMQYQQLSTADQSVIDELDGAALIYIGRVVPTSPNFESPNKEVWNDLYPPTMTENMWALRNTRLNWFNTTNIAQNTAAEDSAILYVRLEDPSDNIFDGLDEMFPDLDLTDTIPWWYGQWNAINPDDYGNGIVMATAVDGTVPVWVRFDDKDEFYPGSVDLPQGERTYFGLGADNGTADFFACYTEVAKEIFLREAAYLSAHLRVEPEKVENHKAEVASKVFFNPATQKLVVEMDNLNRVEVIDISGKFIYTAPAKNKRMLVDLGFVNSGIYLVRLTDKDNNSATKKIIK